MRFTDFLKATVLTSAGAATALAAITVAAVTADADQQLIFIGAAWWAIAVVIGTWLGRRSQPSPAIGRLLAAARTSPMLPELHPARILLNRLWPLLLCTIAAAILALFLPQVPAIATGFCIIWALAWRRQEAAVTAIEDRDGARFYVERTSPLSPIRLTRTPGFTTSFPSLNGSGKVDPALDRG